MPMLTVPSRFVNFLEGSSFLEVPKSITFKLAFGFGESKIRFSGFKSLYLAVSFYKYVFRADEWKTSSSHLSPLPFPCLPMHDTETVAVDNRR